MSKRSGKHFSWGLYLILIVVLIVGCSNTTDNISTPPIEPPDSPDAPGGLEMNDETADAPDEEYQGDDAGDVESPPPEMGEDGNYWIQITLPEVRTDGVYIGVYEEQEEEGEEGTDLPYGGKNADHSTAVCVPGVENEVACPLPGGAEETELQFHVIFLEATIPVLPTSAGYQFYHQATRQVERFGMPPAFEGESPLSQLDSGLQAWRMCKDWGINDGKPDHLDFICPALLVGVVDPADVNPENQKGGDGWGSSSESMVIPDPDCDGKDAGSFWCQETEDQPYTAGRLATQCRDELGITFEDPLTAFEDPLTAFEDPLTAFEDPLTAMHAVEAAFNAAIAGFEDPLTAFEDPLTAFEDPLTAFEDPLTAFEDPLTAVEVGQLALWYVGMRPFIGDKVSFPACNSLALLGDVSHYHMTGEPLFSALYNRYKSPVEVTKPQTVYAPAVMDNPSHCSIYDMIDVSAPYFFVDQGDNNVYLKFPFLDQIPGHSLDVPGDPIPHLYAATLGGVPSERCVPAYDDQVDCDVLMLGRDNQILYDVPVELYVSGCTQPIYSGFITLPGIDYNRCDFFSTVNMGLNIANPATDLQIYVTMDTGVLGLEVQNYSGFDHMPVAYGAFFDGISARGYMLSGFPGRLYSDFSIPASSLNTPKLYELYVNKCNTPIYSQMITVVPGGGGGRDSGGGDGGGTACTGTEPNEYLCDQHNGTWYEYMHKIGGYCTCP